MSLRLVYIDGQRMGCRLVGVPTFVRPVFEALVNRKSSGYRCIFVFADTPVPLWCPQGVC